MNPQKNNESNGYGTSQQSDQLARDTNTVQSYASDVTGAYRLESLEEPLEVHSVQQPVQSYAPAKRGLRFSAFFSRRKAMIVSTLITALVLMITIGAMAFLVRKGPSDDKQNSQAKVQQDVKFENSDDTKIPQELQGAQQSLLVSGDIITRGSLKISDGGFVTVIRVQNPGVDQTVTLPGTSGTFCLDTNNCGYATQEATDTLQGQLGELQSQFDDLNSIVQSLGQVTIPPAGVTELNGQSGSVSLQGSVNRINVSTTNGVVTITTPQDLDANANVQFGNLTLSASGQIRANTLIQTGAGNSISINAGNDMITFVAGGRAFQLPATGGAVQTICTTGATCATGSGTAVILSPGVAQVDGTADSSIFINDTGGGNLIHMQSGGVDRFTISNAGNTTIGGSLTVSGLGDGFVRSTAGTLSVVSAINLATQVTGTLPVANGGTGAADADTARANLLAARRGANNDIDSTTALNTITPSAALTIGTPLQQFTLQGAGNSSISAGSGANITTLAFAAPTGTNTITFPALTGTVCVSTGNCAASGTAGGDLTGSYPNPTIASLQGANLNITTSSNGQVLVYNGANSRWENASVSGDISLSGTGVATIANNAVTTGKIADSNVTNAKLQNSSLTVTSGNGLLNGGAVSLGSAVTINIGQGDGITVNADDIAVDNTVCRTTGNCAGVGGNGDISGTGSNNRLVMFNGAKTVTTSTLLQSAGALTLDSGNNFILTSGNLMLSNGNVDVTGGGNFTGTVSGADATQNDEFVTLSQLNAAIGGVGGGVTSLNSLAGDLDIQGTAGQITINDNGTDTITLSLNTAVTLQGNTFNGVNQLVRLGASGELPVLNASNLTDLNASSLATGTVPSGRLSGSYVGITGLGTVTTGTWNGTQITDNYVQDNITISNLGTVDWTALNNYPAACPAGQAVTQLGDTITCSVFAAGSGSGNYIQNQSASAQTSASFWIDGSGQANTLSASTLTSTVATGTAPFTVASTTVVANLNADSLDGQDGGYYLNIGNATGTLNTARIADGSIGNIKLTNDSITVTSGGGLINGGTIALGGTATLNIGQGDGITVNADDIAVDNTVCRTTGNCAGVGGTGDITGGGTANRLAVFSANKNIVDSYLLQSAGVLTLDNGVDFVLAGGDINVTGAGTFTGTVSGADATQNDEFVTLSQLNAAIGGGGGGGVTTLNSLAGALDIQGTAGQISVGDNGTDTITLSLNAAVTLQGNTFNGPDQLVQLTNAGILPVLDGSNVTNVNAALLQGQNGAYYLDLGNATGTLAIARIADGSITNAKLLNDSITITAGNGLTNGGTTALGGTNTLNIGAGDGITVNADDIAVDATVARLNANANFTANLQQGGNDVCTTAGNCAGVGGTGDITGTGTAGRLAVFDASKNIVNSYLQQSAGTLTLDTATDFVLTAGNLMLTNGDLSVTGDGIFTGSVTATSFIGSGASLTNLDADELTSGIVASARISGSYTGITGVGTVTVGTWNGTAISDAYVQDNITISAAGTVDWTALSNYPASATCAAGSAVTQIDDVVTCSVFAAGSGSGNYIQNQSASAQASSTFWIDGTGRTDGSFRADTSVLSPLLDTASASVLNIGTNNATQINLNKNVVVAAGQSLTITGGNTGSRPAGTEGMVYYDTDTDRLLVYSNGKWQADRSEAILVAASNSSQADKDAADYVADGNTVAAGDGDQIQINAALTAAAGKKVILLAGNYVADATILIPDNTTLSGVGSGTIVELADIDITDNLVENSNTTSGTGIVLRDLKLNGRDDLNSGLQQAIYFNGITGVSGMNMDRTGATVQNIEIVNFSNTAITLNDSTGVRISNSYVSDTVGAITMSGSTGGSHVIANNIFASSGQIFTINRPNNVITGNTITSGGYGIFIVSADNIISNNYISSVTVNAIRVNANNNLVSNNRLVNNGGSNNNDSIFVTSADNNTIVGNTITDTSATTTNYAINIVNAASDNNYVADNTLGTGTINDASGGDTIYGGQVNGSTNYVIQPAGTVELMKSTNVTGTLNITGDVDTNGSLTVGNANQFVVSNLGVVTSGTWQGTALTDAYVANTLTVDSSSNVDWQALNNYPAACPAGQAVTQLGDSITCTAFAAGSGSGNYIQNQNASAQSADFWISGTGRANMFTALEFYATGINNGIFTDRVDVSDSNDLTIGENATNVLVGTANTTVITVRGELQVDQDAMFNDLVTIAAGQALRVTGGVTGTRPGTPTEGMIYYDTTTERLLTYANGKWQADRTQAILVAANDSSQADKDAADFVATGTNDGAIINTAIAALPAGGGTIYLMQGTFTLGATSINMPNNTTLAGTGASTILTYPGAMANATYKAITNSDVATGTHVNIRDIMIDGNRAGQSTGDFYGIYFDNMGTGTGSSAIDGGKINNVVIKNMYGLGIYLAASSNNTITGNTVTGANLYGISLNASSNNNTITGNMLQYHNNASIHVSASSDNTITGNTTEGSNYGMFLQTASNNTITGNTVIDNTNYGIRLDTSSSNTVNGNNLRENGFRSINLNSSSNNNTITGNTITDSGGGGNNAIYLSASDNNSITSNNISDSSCGTGTATCYAINIFDVTSDNNYLADNNMTDTDVDATTTINDAGTGTVFGGQVKDSSNGNFFIQPAGTVELMKNTNVTGTLNVTGNLDTNGSLTVGNANQFVISNTGVVTSGTWQAGTIGLLYGGTNNTSYTTNGIVYSNGTSLVSTGAGTTGQCLLATTGGAPTWNSCTASDLQGTYNASTPATILLADNKSFTINTNDVTDTYTVDPSIIFNLNCSTCSANGGRFAVQDAGVDILTVLPNGDIRLGTAANNMTLSAANGYKPELSGTAQNVKRIRLLAEYPSAVLDPDLTNNLGTMTSGFDSTSRMNYYKWTTTQVANQDYDIVVQVPLPLDFGSWASSSQVSVDAYTSNTTNGTIGVTVLGTDGLATSCTNANVTPGSTGTWTASTACALGTGTYTAGGYITLRIKLQSPTSGDTRVGNIVLNYNSKF